MQLSSNTKYISIIYMQCICIQISSDTFKLARCRFCYKPDAFCKCNVYVTLACSTCATSEKSCVLLPQIQYFMRWFVFIAQLR